MGLTLKTKATFEYDDGISKTTIPLTPGDDEETICRKLRKVLELAEPARDVSGAPMVPAHDLPVELAKQKFRRDAWAPQTGNGWAKYAKPEVPEHLKGEVEVIGEEGSDGSA